jgi:dTDP-4-amino-4,6-dideoxygalactose transaminase
MPVHLYGQCVDMQALLAVAGNIPVVEDAAQAIGAKDADGRRAGSMGLAGCFSFFPSKNLGGAGDGGFITTNDDAFAHKLRVMRNHGAQVLPQGAGALRLDALQTRCCA